MQIIRRFGRALVIGFLFGTIGVFILALLALLHPLFESISAPFLLPGRLLARSIADMTASGWTIVVLYVGTGVFYAFAAVVVQLAAGVARKGPPRT